MKTITITVYQQKRRANLSASSKKSDWRWKIQAGNRKIIASSSEGYRRLQRCLDNLSLITGIEHEGCWDNHAIGDRREYTASQEIMVRIRRASAT